MRFPGAKGPLQRPNCTPGTAKSPQEPPSEVQEGPREAPSAPLGLPRAAKDAKKGVTQPQTLLKKPDRHKEPVNIMLQAENVDLVKNVAFP